MDLPTLDSPPVLLGEGGAPRHEPAQSAEGARLAVRLGADGVAFQGSVGPEGVLIPAAPATRRPWGRRRPEPPPSFREVAASLGSGAALLVSMAGDTAPLPDMTQLADLADLLGPPTELGRVWIEGGLSAWADRDCHDAPPGLACVVAITTTAMPTRPEHFARDLRARSLAGVRLPASEWSGGLVAMFHRFGLQCHATGADHHRIVAELLRMGTDVIRGRTPEIFDDVRSGRSE